MLCTTVSQLIGQTPVMPIAVPNRNASLVLKLEKNNPGGSMKDRMARSMVLAALEDGRLPPGGTIVESSSGNTGIGLAIIALELGLRFIAVVDHHAAPDKIRMMRALGAEIRYVEGDYREDEVAVVARQRLAAQLGAQLPGALFMNQSDNPANPAGYAGFVEELLTQLPDGVDAYVGCVGTGGSMTGIAQRLKKLNPAVRTVAVEPAGSIVFGKPGHPYYQSGTGTPAGDDIGKVLDYSCIDEGVQVTDTQAFETARFIARRYGLLVGGSTGGAIYKALEFIAAGKLSGTVLTPVADGGEKYLGSIFDDDWMAKRNLLDPAVAMQLEAWLPGRARAA
ncbi:MULTISPECIES: PLP-dependent cysteine synthase family protein [Bradyrhizobium]|jgi:cystathionine beta-synthase|uniref:Cysteine synthase family protein n=1 Tax=Bradyrhizobium denitrificans TaxID=2734912 RepID=A0ABS5G9A8_9BRAD|nr:MULTISPECIES: cysteine synthase family protein [Bradyrhizobium]RTL95525.1 MAG: cysteine synthase family protein [Bradyrhizobiaceae bacterium]ABQ32902.1 putative cysteine synthase (O-acetylserine sulfhydrylase) (O-acetylserine (Thiol)-lyase) (CSase) [Bradyrhizobium sp. BTAi1]MBR1137915.1 cysteine synthase family protein [Bradyrhizobium denitrificans]MCL8485264.1 cysteine synthase family protein [Bradyrhizobium denitrificans]MDU0954903.1 cysteine synthase family protein [Bradyrhizobium sp.]